MSTKKKNNELTLKAAFPGHKYLHFSSIMKRLRDKGHDVNDMIETLKKPNVSGFVIPLEISSKDSETVLRYLQGFSWTTLQDVINKLY